jgi:hypothetical protein
MRGKVKPLGEGNTSWRTELTLVENKGDEVWIGVKG